MRLSRSVRVVISVVAVFAAFYAAFAFLAWDWNAVHWRGLRFFYLWTAACVSLFAAVFMWSDR